MGCSQSTRRSSLSVVPTYESSAFEYDRLDSVKVYVDPNKNIADACGFSFVNAKLNGTDMVLIDEVFTPASLDACIVEGRRIAFIDNDPVIAKLHWICTKLRSGEPTVKIKLADIEEGLEIQETPTRVFEGNVPLIIEEWDMMLQSSVLRVARSERNDGLNGLITYDDEIVAIDGTSVKNLMDADKVVKRLGAETSTCIEFHQTAQHLHENRQVSFQVPIDFERTNLVGFQFSSSEVNHNYVLTVGDIDEECLDNEQLQSCVGKQILSINGISKMYGRGPIEIYRTAGDAVSENDETCSIIVRALP